MGYGNSYGGGGPSCGCIIMIVLLIIMALGGIITAIVNLVN